MHYYTFNIGNYRRDTTHLTLLEHGAYRQLIDTYYLKEQPISLDLEKVMRTHCARTDEEKAAIEYILNEYFTKTEEGYLHQSCEDLISKYNEKSEKARKSAEARWDKTKDNANALRTHSEGNANHKPITINHITKEKHIRENPTDISPSNAVPFQKIVDLYHEKLPMLPKVEKLTKTRQGYIRQRWLYDLPDLNHWENFFDHVGQSDFLIGKTNGSNGKPPFRANLEWLTKEGNFVKISEDKYHG